MLINETLLTQKLPISSNCTSATQRNTQTNNRRIFLSHKGCYHQLNVKDIRWIASEGNYAHIYTNNKHFFNRISLSQLLELLPHDAFRKVHKCYIVKLDAIDYIDRTNSELVIDNNKIPIGRSYKAKLLAQLNLIG